MQTVIDLSVQHFTHVNDSTVKSKLLMLQLKERFQVNQVLRFLFVFINFVEFVSVVLLVFMILKTII